MTLFKASTHKIDNLSQVNTKHNMKKKKKLNMAKHGTSLRLSMLTFLAKYWIYWVFTVFVGLFNHWGTCGWILNIFLHLALVLSVPLVIVSLNIWLALKIRVSRVVGAWGGGGIFAQRIPRGLYVVLNYSKRKNATEIMHTDLKPA